MENKKLSLALLVIILVFGFMLVGCDMDSDPTYTVWTDFVPYSTYSSSFGSLADGYYVRYEFTSSEWNSIKSSLTSDGRHEWSESDLKKWLIGRGFGNTEANKETSWLVTIGHGFIASRTGSTVYMLLK